MNEQQSAGADRPPTDRAEEMLGRLGQRFHDIRANVSHALEQRAQRQANGGDQSGSGQSASARTQDVLEGWGERVGFLAGAAGLRMRQWGARAREEAEDLWAEAQTMRQQTGTTRTGNGHTGNGHTVSADRGDGTTAEQPDARDAEHAEPLHHEATDTEQRESSTQPS